MRQIAILALMLSLLTRQRTRTEWMWFIAGAVLAVVIAAVVLLLRGRF